MLLAALPLSGGAKDLEGVTAVASRVCSDYVRAKLPDGSFRPEFFAFGEGGKWAGELDDATIDRLSFRDVAQAVAVPLAARKYLPSKDPDRTTLLIMLYWGTTAVPGPASASVAYDELSAAQANINGFTTSSGSQRGGIAGGLSSSSMSLLAEAMTLVDIENHQRDTLDLKNARMLGYDSEGLIGTDYGNNIRGTAFGARRTELVSEIEENRYFVVLMAYDFQLMWKQRKHKLLWETRFSISERRNAFDKALPLMAQYASRYFGQDSHGLLRTQVAEGRVDVGETKSLGEVEAPMK